MEISGTRAYMAAQVLDKAAKECEEAADTLKDAEFSNAAANQAVLSSWYTEVAQALRTLDDTGEPITAA